MTNKILTLIACGLITTSLLSCGKAEESDLKINFTTKKAFLIEADSFSCYDLATASTTKSIRSKYASYLSLNIEWANKEATVTVYTIKFSFKSPLLSSGGFDRTISGDELGAIFDQGGTAGPWTGVLPAATVDGSGNTVNASISNATSACALRFGGIGTETDNSFELTGDVTVTGVSRNAKGEEKTVKGKATVTIMQ